MDAQYQPFHQRADRLHFRCNEVIDDPGAPLAQRLKQQAKQIVQDLQANKAPRHIEDDIKVIQQELESLRAGGQSVMTPNDAEELRHDYEDLRRSLRALPNY